jgi:hypothetical protein
LGTGEPFPFIVGLDLPEVAIHSLTNYDREESIKWRMMITKLSQTRRDHPA